MRAGGGGGEGGGVQKEGESWSVVEGRPDGRSREVERPQPTQWLWALTTAERH